MEKFKVLLTIFSVAIAFVVVTVSIDKMQKADKKIEDLETSFLRERDNNRVSKKTIEDLRGETVDLYSRINNLENDLGQAQWDLANERENHEKTKADLSAEVDALKKKRAIIAKEKAQAAASKIEEPTPKSERKETKEKTINGNDRKIDMRVTAYGADCNGCEGKTASGTDYTQGRTLACPPQYDFGTKIEIPALGGTFICEDRGGAIKGNTFDMFHGSSESAASSFGVKYVEGYIRKD